VTTDVLRLDSLRPAYTEDPYPVLTELREAGPVHRVELIGLPVWLVTRYDDVRALFGDLGLSTDPRHANERLMDHPFVRVAYTGKLSRHMMTAEPPDHTRLRRVVNREFTPRRIEALRPRIQQVTDDLIGRFAGRGAADLIDELAAPLPITIIMELLGVPLADQGDFRHWVDVMTGVEEGDHERVPEMNARAAAYLTDLVSRLKAEPAGEAGRSLLGALAHVPEGEERLDDVELASLAELLMVAGYTTTIDLIGNGMLALLRNPDQMAALRADPSLLPGAVEEFLRYDGPVAGPMLRFAVTDLTVGDTVIPAGDMVMLSIASANRDPARFDRPNLLDISRTDRGHVAFGYGIHYCLGAPLARLEGSVALGALLAAFPDIALEPAAELRWRISLNIRGLRALPVRFTPLTEPARIGLNATASAEGG
jgi:cytochrome P450